MEDYQQPNQNDNFQTRQEPPKAGGLSRGRVILILQIIGFAVIGLLLIALIPMKKTPNTLPNETRSQTTRSLTELDEVFEKQATERKTHPEVKTTSSTREDKEEQKARRSKLTYNISRGYILERKRSLSNTDSFSQRLGLLSKKLSSSSIPVTNGKVYKDGIAPDPEQDPGRQFRKHAFLTKPPARSITNPYGLQRQLSPYVISGGTVINAALISGISSDLPGQIVAQVTQNVFNSTTGRTLLIPQGSKLLGKYDSVIAFDQERVLLVWYRMILPNGNSVILDNLPASDEAGYSGLKDEVDNHTWEKIKGVALATLLSIGTQLSFGDNDDELLAALRDGIQATTERATEKMISKYLNRQATLKIRPGWPMAVLVNKDLVLTPYLSN